jgi:hypothetical protein
MFEVYASQSIRNSNVEPETKHDSDLMPATLAFPVISHRDIKPQTSNLKHLTSSTGTSFSYF